MFRIVLHRPVIQMLLPAGLLVSDAALALLIALRLRWPLFVILSAVLLLLALGLVANWHNSFYEIYAFAGTIKPLLLVSSSGIFQQERSARLLGGLVGIDIQAPWLWAWCDGAEITLHFEDGEPVALGMVGGASQGGVFLTSSIARRVAPGFSAAGD